MFFLSHNRPFYSSLLSGQVFEKNRGCGRFYDTNLVAFQLQNDLLSQGQTLPLGFREEAWLHFTEL